MITRILRLGVLLAVSAGCQTAPVSPGPARDINAVLADHEAEWLALPGVVGVYVGLLRDGKTTCLKVMLAQDDPSVRQKLPRLIEGYAVVPEVTGLIKPLSN